MIYSPNNNEPLVLVEGAADEFLEAVGVKLFDDEISINGTLYEGSYGESILESDGIFLYEDGIVLEGKQAEEYKARKAKEKADRESTELKRALHRYAPVGTNDPSSTAGYKTAPTGHKNVRGKNPNYKYYAQDPKRWQEDEDRATKAERIVFRDWDSKSGRGPNPVDPKKFKNGAPHYKPKGYVGAYHFSAETDAVNRHMRRHPKQYKESTIFSNIEII